VPQGLECPEAAEKGRQKMDYLTITFVLIAILYLLSIEWKELADKLKAGGWFFILVYVVMGIAIFKFFMGGAGH